MAINHIDIFFNSFFQIKYYISCSRLFYYLAESNRIGSNRIESIHSIRKSRNNIREKEKKNKKYKKKTAFDSINGQI